MSDDGYAPASRKPPRVLAIVFAVIAIGAFGYAMFSKRWLYNPGTVLEVREGEAKGATYGPPHEISIGLRDLEMCVEGQCGTRSNSEHVADWRDTVLVLRYANGEAIEGALRDAGGDALVARGNREREQVMESVSHGGGGFASHAELVVARQLLTYSSAWPTVGWVTFLLLALATLSLVVATGFVIARRKLQWPIMPTTVALLAIFAALVIGCMFGALKLGPPGYVGVSFGFFAFGGGVIFGFTAALLLNKHLRPDDHDLLEDSMNPEQF